MSQQGILRDQTVDSGEVKQVVTNKTNAFISVTTLIPPDNTIPQQTEGTQVLTATITPTKATNLLYISASIGGTIVSSAIADNFGLATLFQDATANALTSLTLGTDYVAVGNTFFNGVLVHTMTAGTTSPTTFKLRCGNATALGGESLQINGGVAALYGGTLFTTIIVQEIEV